MNPPTRILAATDLSAPARHAAERAALTCQALGADLDLLHVADLGPLDRLRQLMNAEPADLETRVLGAAQQKLQALGDALQRRYGVEPTLQAVAGSLLSELSTRMAAAPPDLLVCGARGESVIRHMVLGTTALRILSTASCPVLVVKQPPHESYRRVLIPVDFSPSSLRAIHTARTVAPDADIVLMHAFDVPFEGHLRYASVDEDTIHHYRIVAREEAIQKLQALREEAGLSAAHSSLVVAHGDPTSRIVEQEQECDSDLIVIGKHGASLLQDWLLGSVTKQVLAQSQGDVLMSV